MDVLRRLLASRKAVASLTAAVAVLLVRLSPLSEADAAVVAQAIVILAVTYVGAQSVEDAAEKRDSPSPKQRQG